MKMNSRKLLTIGLFFIINFASVASQGTQVREKLIFNNDWKFILNDNPEYRDSVFNDTSWRTLNLPHDWSIEGAFEKSIGGSGGYFPIGIGWYRKTFTLPKSMSQKQVILQFDGVYMNSEVWINGKFLGRYPYGFTTFQYDLTEYLTKKGEVNTIAVRVDNSLKESTRWYTGSGIYRNVWLIATNFVHFDSYKGVSITTPQVTEEKATVNIDYDFTVNFFSNNDRWKKETKKLIVRSTIYDKIGNQIAAIETENNYENLNPGYLLNQKIVVDQPKLWSTKCPAMYTLKSEIISDGKVIDDQITSFGIRRLEYIPNKGMFVNGKTEKLKGVCLHQDVGSFGVAVPIEIWRQRLLKFKEMGCNAVRTSHHPFAPEFYDLCDTLGLYVMNEAFDEWTSGWYYNYTDNNKGKAPNGYQLYFNQWAETDLKAMLWRDRNHPSVVMFSIGNEIPDQRIHNGYKTARKLVDICHTVDNTRPVTSGCDQYSDASKNGFMDQLDISGYNYVDRDFKEKMYEPEHAKRPEKLCIGTETSKTTQNFTAYRDNDYVVGGFIWVGTDYFGESTEYPRRGFPSGLMNIAGFEKPEYYLYKSYWNDKPTVQIAVGLNKVLESKWNWNANDSLTVHAYSNCDEVELIINKRSLGRKSIDKNLNFTTSWKVKYKEGLIKAIGYNANKKVAEHILKTSTEAYQFSAKFSKTTLIADGKDISLVEIALIDKKGVPVPDADNAVTVNVTGNGNLIGLDSGDLYYLGLFKTNIRKVFKGKLLLAIRSTDKTGDISVELNSEKIAPLKFKIVTVK